MVLQDMLQGRASLTAIHANRPVSARSEFSNECAQAWVGNGTDDVGKVNSEPVNSMTLSIPAPTASTIERDSKASSVGPMTYINRSLFSSATTSTSVLKKPTLPARSKKIDSVLRTPLDSKKTRKTNSLKVQKPTIPEDRLTRVRQSVYRCMHGRKLEYVVGALIVANAAVLGHQSDRGVKKLNEEPLTEYRVFDVIFTISFTLELVLRLFADGPFFFFSSLNRDRNWNIFDLIMVLSAIVDEIVGLLALGRNANMSAIRIMRLLRLARVIRVIRVMRVFQDLRLMVAGIVSCAKPFVCLAS